MSRIYKRQRRRRQERGTLNRENSKGHFDRSSDHYSFLNKEIRNIFLNNAIKIKF